MKSNIPEEIKKVLNVVENAGYQVYLVGGCVRDMLRGVEPKDWDATTNATPEQIQALFDVDDTFYENSFGTVGLKTESEDERLKIVEITPYRVESGYSDARRPDEIRFADTLEEDLERRDFTMNAIAYSIAEDKVVDLYGGQGDIDRKVIKAVGNPDKRFSEDALRMMRAIRLSAELNFAIDGETLVAIGQNVDLLAKISKERIRDEFVKIVMSDTPLVALGMAQKIGMLKYIIPELEDGVGCEQGKKAHKYDVFEHLLRALQHSADKGLCLEERLSAFFHDIGKPFSRREKGGGYTFYGHEVVGARMVKKIMKDLRFSKQISNDVEKFVRWHMFFSDPDMITLSAVRRMIVNVGQENIQKLLNIRMCDRIGSGRPKEQPFRFRKYQAMVDEALRDPISVGMLKIDGGYLMKEFGIKPGPRIGWVLSALLELVLDDPKNNTQEFLHTKAEEYLKFDDKELHELGKKGKEKREEEEQKEIKELQRKYKVG